MSSFAPIPIKDHHYWFYLNDRIKDTSEVDALVVDVFPWTESDRKFIYKYIDELQEVDTIPVLDLWYDSLEELFWILSPETDYIVKLYIPSLTPQPVYVARDLDGGWHAFETIAPNIFGFLDTTGEYHKQLSEK